MKVKFRTAKLSQANRERLELINSIIEEYQEEGLILTLRQLYYQLVSRKVIPNRQTEYSKLSNLLKEGRMSGIVDWEAIEDRLRVPYTPASFDSPRQIVEAAIQQFKMPRMKGQKNYVEVWVEKDALSGVLRRVTSQYHVPILVNRGYSSATAMFDSYERFKEAIMKDQFCTILYLGDFDPSGQDMIRDIKDRTLEFLLNDTRLNIHANDFWDKDDQSGYESELEDKYYDNEWAQYDAGDEKWYDKDRAWIIDRFQVVPIALTRI
jgi:hypothetical protein